MVCHKVYRNFRFSHRICVLIGSTNLTIVMRNRLCHVDLLPHYHRKSAISSTGPIQNDGLFVQHGQLLQSSSNCTSRYTLGREVLANFGDNVISIDRVMISSMTSQFRKKCPHHFETL